MRYDFAVGAKFVCCSEGIEVDPRWLDGEFEVATLDSSGMTLRREDYEVYLTTPEWRYYGWRLVS